MSEFLAGVVVGVVLGVASSVFWGPLLGALGAARARFASRRQDLEDELLLRAIRVLVDRDPNMPVARHEVREEADVPGLSDKLDRLQHKGYIVELPDRPNWFALTDEGYQAASEPRRAWWRRWFGG